MLANINILERLRVDSGRRTFGELLQDREAALNEIRRLRREIEQLRHIREDRRHKSAAVQSAVAAQNFSNGMLLWIVTVCELVDLIECAFLERQIDGLTADLAYLLLQNDLGSIGPRMLPELQPKQQRC